MIFTYSLVPLARFSWLTSGATPYFAWAAILALWSDSGVPRTGDPRRMSCMDRPDGGAARVPGAALTCNEASDRRHESVTRTSREWDEPVAGSMMSVEERGRMRPRNKEHRNTQPLYSQACQMTTRNH